MLRKTRSLLQAVPQEVLAQILVLAVWALRPLVVLRFGVIPSRSICAFSLQMEIYLCERDAGLHGEKPVDVFLYNRDRGISNLQLKRMWDRRLHVPRFVSLPARVNRRLPQRHRIPMRTLGDRDIHGLLDRTKPHLSFTAEEERQGWVGLRELGIPEGAPFICFHARDPAYTATVKPEDDRASPTYRDCSIHNFLPAVEELVHRGYYALRMGSVVQEPLATSNERIIDYATNGRTDFLDIYLGAKCRFFLGCLSGLYGVPMAFRRPVVQTNCVPLEHAPAWTPHHLIIPKKLWLRQEKRFLTFREILAADIGRYLHVQLYEQDGIDPIENTPEEITAVAIEMDERLNGTWQTTEEDEELQKRFWSLFKPSELNQVFLSHVGADFVRENTKLLE